MPLPGEGTSSITNKSPNPATNIIMMNILTPSRGLRYHCQKTKPAHLPKNNHNHPILPLSIMMMIILTPSGGLRYHCQNRNPTQSPKNYHDHPSPPLNIMMIILTSSSGGPHLPLQRENNRSSLASSWVPNNFSRLLMEWFFTILWAVFVNIAQKNFPCLLMENLFHNILGSFCEKCPKEVPKKKVPMQE